MYSLPHCDPAQFKDPEMQQKFKDGPQAFITILPGGVPQMGGNPRVGRAYTVGYMKALIERAEAEMAEG